MMAASQFASLKSCDHLSASPFTSSQEARLVLAWLSEEMLQVKVEFPSGAEQETGWGMRAKAQPRWRNISGGVKNLKGQDQHLHLTVRYCKGNINWKELSPLTKPGFVFAVFVQGAVLQLFIVFVSPHGYLSIFISISWYCLWKIDSKAGLSAGGKSL